MAYFKYVKRNAESQIDWRTVSKTISDSLIAERDLREEKKAKIEEDSRQYGIKLEDAPDTQIPTLNEFYMDFANNAKDYRLVQDNLLKSGVLNVRDYTRNRQNLMDDTDRLKDVVTSLGEEAKLKLERNQNLESAGQEMWELEYIQGFATFGQSGVYLDPMTGRASIATKKGDGLDLENTMTLDALLKNLGKKVNRYNVQDGITSFTDSLGQEISVLRKRGILRVSDIRDRELSDEERGMYNAYQESKDNFVSSILSNPDTVSSVFSDSVGYVDGKPVDFTTDPKKAGGNVMLLEPNPTSGMLEAKPTEEQMKLVRQYVSDQIDIEVDREEEAMAEFAPQRSYGGGGGKEDRLDVTLISQLYGGDRESADAAANTLENYRNKDFYVTDVTREDDGVTFTRVDNETGETVTQTFPFVTDDGVPKSEAAFDMEVASFLGEADVARELEMADYQGFESPSQLGTTITGRTQRGEVKPFDELVIYDASADAMNTPDNLIAAADDEVKAAAAARQIISQLPEEKKKGSDIVEIPEDDIQDYLGKGMFENAYGATQVYVPEVMTGPIFVPADDDLQRSLRAVMEKVYEAGRGKDVMLTPNDFEQLIPDFNSYNSQNVYNGLGIGIDWNSGNADAAKLAGKNMGTASSKPSGGTGRAGTF
jgi:hypothetical protein